MKKTHLIILSLFLTSAIISTATVSTYKALTVPKSNEYVVETIEANSKGYIKVGIISDAQLPQEEKNLYGWDYATAVSYTHLDVYKRQNLNSIIDEAVSYLSNDENAYFAVNPIDFERSGYTKHNGEWYR